MRKARIEYSKLVEDALRTVVRDVLQDAAKDGITAPHNFYITFKTAHPGVDIPDFLQQRYPIEMTIVLQYQFWELEVQDDLFMVTLSFNDQLYRLVIPFAAIKVFADPGVEFGLQFTLEDDDDQDDETDSGDQTVAGILDRADTDNATPLPRPQPRVVSDDGDAAEPGEGAEIVTLDRFRKK